jgi:hypothetical protein
MTSRKAIRIVLIIALALAGLFAASWVESAGRGDYLLLRRVSIVDPAAFGRPVEAASILLPKNWAVKSSVVWTADLGCVRNSIQIRLEAHSPDGKLGFEIFPNYSWTWMDDPQMRYYAEQAAMSPFGIKGCELLPVLDATSYLQDILLPRWRPGAKLIGIGQVPELIQAAKMDFLAATGGSTEGVVQTDFDVALAAIETPRARGTDEEWLLAGLVRTTSYLPTLAGMGAYGNQMAGNHMMAAYANFAARAPKGQLEKNEKLFDVIYRSYKLNPTWEAAITQHYMTIDQINLKGVQDRQRIIHESQQEISAMIEQGHLRREAIRDRSAERQIQSLRGVETYIDPATRTSVELAAGYQGAWTNGLGDYVLSDSPSFNPVRELNGSWTALKPAGR